MSTENGFDTDMIETLGPEFTVFVGLLLIMTVPNLGNGTFRIPGTSIRIPSPTRFLGCSYDGSRIVPSGLVSS